MFFILAIGFPVQAELPDWQQYFQPAQLNRLEQRFGPDGVARVQALEQWLLAQLAREATTAEQLEAVNHYFNRLDFISDAEHWGQADYWATPLETVASGGGDCEDFVIAKYFALRVLGVPPPNLRLMYAKAIELNQAHMVLLYLNQPDAMPKVLDNLLGEIRDGDARPDLVPVYSFNAEGLWRARAFDQGVRLKAGESGVDLWGDLMMRLAQEGEG
ncbi:transglutaminase-like cysteine peptidase [Ferrimonas gelatinilytica]|uniref:Transglutaminase-like cysteine peptidase n=1 Tax=Ferrimonas gelatinilytica TaxID=1255257 RepID=A0ABP9SG92_9GAMM